MTTKQNVIITTPSGAGNFKHEWVNVTRVEHRTDLRVVRFLVDYREVEVQYGVNAICVIATVPE